MIAVRSVRPGDVESIAALRMLAGAEAASKRGGPELIADLGEVNADPSKDADLLVATIDDQPIGFAEISWESSRATLAGLFTHPEARGVGVGHALLAVAVERAVERGCTGIDSYALPGDRDTKNFFESHAMKSRVLVVRLDLSAPADFTES